MVPSCFPAFRRGPSFCECGGAAQCARPRLVPDRDSNSSCPCRWASRFFFFQPVRGFAPAQRSPFVLPKGLKSMAAPGVAHWPKPAGPLRIPASSGGCGTRCAQTVLAILPDSAAILGPTSRGPNQKRFLGISGSPKTTRTRTSTTPIRAKPGIPLENTNLDSHLRVNDRWGKRGRVGEKRAGVFYQKLLDGNGMIT